MIEFVKLEAMLAKIPKEMGKVEAQIGWFSSSHYPDGISVAEVAAVQEFGEPRQYIPARPMLGPTVAKEKMLGSIK